MPSGRAPFGYRKREDGRLEVHEAEAAQVREAFRQRAAGLSFAQIGRGQGWAHATNLLRNEAYVGVARSGEFVNERAHPAIVTRELFDAANAARTKQPVPPGDTTRERLLVGLARCAGCGRTLKVVRRKQRGGHVSAYYCKDASSVPCTERAYVHADDLDRFVAGWFERALGSAPRMIDAVAAAHELEEAHGEQAAAEAELVAYVEAASALDAALFQRGLSARQARADGARAQVRELSARVTRIPSGGSLATLWAGFGPVERRDVLLGFLDRVEVARGASGDLAGHVRVLWADGSLAKVPEDEERVRVAAA